MDESRTDFSRILNDLRCKRQAADNAIRNLEEIRDRYPGLLYFSLTLQEEMERSEQHLTIEEYRSRSVAMPPPEPEADAAKPGEEPRE